MSRSRKEQTALERHRPADGVFDPETNSYLTGTGARLYNVHDANLCRGRACVIHRPSDHSMRAFPTHWRSDRGIMERLCPHGVGHPDPDDLAYWESIGVTHQGIHGCDGCCHRRGMRTNTSPGTRWATSESERLDPPGQGFGASLGAVAKIQLAASRGPLGME